MKIEFEANGSIEFGQDETSVGKIGPAELWAAARLLNITGDMQYEQVVKMRMMQAQALQSDIARAVQIPGLKRV